MAIYDNRICIRCKRRFSGGPRAWYCPDCREERRRERDRKYTHRPSKRPLGSVDICANCGKKYVVNSGLQKYCPDCSPIKHKEIDNKQGTEYYRKHYNTETARQKRSEKRRIKYQENKDETNRKRREKYAERIKHNGDESTDKGKQ